MIAIKDTGSPVGKKARLKICGYAIVKKIDGKIYEYNGDELGHLVYVDFIEKYSNKEFVLGYGKTIHKLHKIHHIKEIFGRYFEPDLLPKINKGVSTKNTNPHTRKINSSISVVNAAHNKLQLEFYTKLIKKYGKKNVIMEDNYVDIKLIEKNKITFFEIKPYSSASLCIREALGQLLDYLWKEERTKLANSKIVVIGPTKPTINEVEYIDFLKNNLNIEFDYQCID